MKWIGALLFIATSTWIGFEWSHHLHQRPKHIRQLKNALQVLEAEILYSHLPLHDAFQTIGKQIPHPTGELFQKLANGMIHSSRVDFGTLWNDQIEIYMNMSAIGSNEREILKQFGQTLGQHDFTQQQKHIHLTISHLNRELEEARDNQQRYGKMAKSIGFLCGLFIILLFI
ncbi:stage III sporulation protein SpoIIIAB [Virgibacillus sp. W0430]|uniref:stage III sporulation protein SpoIIIAB n=1 Tax=Virgibacillus sp. W0430 TaxID=3391580 RepID=UPI003F474ED4